jgi:acyl carrier protein
MFYAMLGVFFGSSTGEGRAMQVNDEVNDEVSDEVKQVISKTLQIPVEQLGDSSTLGDLGAESIDVIELVFELDDKFDIEISIKSNPEALVLNTGTNTPDLSEIGLMTVGDIVGAVKRLVDAKTA